jgi:hypothetical protein
MEIISAPEFALTLYEAHMNEEKMRAVAETLVVNKNLTELNLGRNKLGSSMATAIMANSTLKSLYLRECSIDIPSLSMAMCINTSITNLDLGRCEIGDGSDYIYQIVKTKTLKILGLGYCNLFIDEKFADALAENTSLTQLDISGNPIGIVGISRVASALAVNTGLTDINMSSLFIRDDGALEIAHVIKINTTLTSMNLSACGMTSAGLVLLQEALEKNKILTHIDLRYLCDTSAAIDKLLDRNKFLRTHTDTILSRMVIAMAFVKANKANNLKYMGLQQLVQTPIVDFISKNQDCAFVKKLSAFSHTAYFKSFCDF